MALDRVVFRQALAFFFPARVRFVALFVGEDVFVGLIGPFDLVQRWLGQVDVAVFDQRAHVAEQQGQQQRGDVLPVDVGVGHQDDAVVAGLFDVEFLTDTGTERGDHGLDFGITQRTVDAGAFDIEDLASQRQDRLGAWVTALLSGTAGRVTFDDVDFGLRRVLRGAVRQFAGHAEGFQRRFAAGVFACFPGGHAGVSGLLGLTDDVACRAGMRLEPVTELFGHGRVHVTANFRVSKFGFGLALELWFGQFHGDHGGEAFANVFTREVFVLIAQDLFLARVAVDQRGQRAAEAFLVRATLVGVDRVGVGVDGFGVGGGPLHGHFNGHALLHVFFFERDNVVVDQFGALGLIQVGNVVQQPVFVHVVHETDGVLFVLGGLTARVVAVFGLDFGFCFSQGLAAGRFASDFVSTRGFDGVLALIGQRDAQALIEKRHLLEACP